MQQRSEKVWFDPFAGAQGLTPGWTPEPRSRLIVNTQNSENKLGIAFGHQDENLPP